MTREDIINKAYIILLPYTKEIGGSPKPYDFSEFLKGKDYVTFDPPTDSDLYIWPDQTHHYTVHWHYTHTLPVIVKMLGMDYDPYDFYKIDNHMDGFGDLSYLIPKTQQTYTVDRFVYDGKLYIKRYFVQSNEISWSTYTYNYLDVSPRKLDPYHSLFMFPHSECHITNLTSDNGKTLILIGDSHLIPLIPILCRYYHNIYILDDMAGKIPLFDHIGLKDVEDADILLMLWEGRSVESYIVTNLL